MGAAAGSQDTGHLLPWQCCQSPGQASGRGNFGWKDRMVESKAAREDSALPWTQLRHPSNGVSVGALWAGRAPDHPSCRDPSPRPPQEPSEPLLGETVLSQDMFGSPVPFLLLPRSAAGMGRFLLGWMFLGGGWLCLSSAAGRKEQLPRGLLALRPGLALLGRAFHRRSATGHSTRRREEQIRTCVFEEVMPGLNSAPAFLFSPVVGKVKLERSQKIKPRAPAPCPGVTGDWEDDP